jgi:hypothetical protein
LIIAAGQTLLDNVEQRLDLGRREVGATNVLSTYHLSGLLVVFVLVVFVFVVMVGFVVILWLIRRNSGRICRRNSGDLNPGAIPSLTRTTS